MLLIQTKQKISEWLRLVIALEKKHKWVIFAFLVKRFVEKKSQEVHWEIYFPAYVGFLKVEVACLKIGFSPVSHLCSILSFSNL